MTRHHIAATAHTVHGFFSPELQPVITIQPGDTVEFATLDAGWGLEQRTSIAGPRRTLESDHPRLPRGHALTGPVAIAGAQPGMVLAVAIGALEPGAWGWNIGGGWRNGINEHLGVADGEGVLHQWALDATTMTGRNLHGYTVPLRPFMGVMGVAPGEPGQHSTIPPRIVGGNIDCRELVVGSTLYLPVQAPGALFSTGDGHGAQGDGEVSGTGIECPMQRVELTFTLRDDLPLTTPWAQTPAGWLTMGFDEDLNLATVVALNSMLDLMHHHFGLNRKDALAIASVVVDLHITQIVNGVRGVHALLPHGSIR
ncbi:MAG: acetamidase/formamidase family protein [Herpetosiphon sp.]